MLAKDKDTLLPGLEKKILTDAQGNPTQVVIPYDEFLEFVESRGLDLSETEQEQVLQSKKEFDEGNRENFIPLDQV